MSALAFTCPACGHAPKGSAPQGLVRSDLEVPGGRPGDRTPHQAPPPPPPAAPSPPPAAPPPSVQPAAAPPPPAPPPPAPPAARPPFEPVARTPRDTSRDSSEAFPHAPGPPQPPPGTVPGVVPSPVPQAFGPPIQRPVELRPLSVGEVIDVSIKLYRRHAGTLLKLVALVVVPVQILSALIVVSVIPDESSTSLEGISDSFQGMATGLFLTAVLGLLATLLANAVSVKAVRDAYLGQAPDVGASFAFVGRRFGSLIWMFTVGGVLLMGIIFVATFLVILGGGVAGSPLMAVLGFLVVMVFIGVIVVRWTVAVPALLVEDVRGWRALQRSSSLVIGRFFPTLGVVALSGLMTLIFTSILRLAMGPLFSLAGDSLVTQFISSALSDTIGSLLVTPFSAAAITILYFDLRIRKEGFDIELLAQGIGGPAAQPSEPFPQNMPAPRISPSAAKPSPSATPPPSAPKRPQRPARPARPAPGAPSAPAPTAEPDPDAIFRKPSPPADTEPVVETPPVGADDAPGTSTQPPWATAPTRRPVPRRPAPRRPQTEPVDGLQDAPESQGTTDDDDEA